MTVGKLYGYQVGGRFIEPGLVMLPSRKMAASFRRKICSTARKMGRLEYNGPCSLKTLAQTGDFTISRLLTREYINKGQVAIDMTYSYQSDNQGLQDMVRTFLRDNGYPLRRRWGPVKRKDYYLDKRKALLAKKAKEKQKEKQDEQRQQEQ